VKDVTLGDIAQVAKCSKNTVSLALRGSSRISDTRKEEINKISHAMGYVPNLSARHLSAKRTGYIGIYTKALNDAVRTTLVNHLISGFHGTGLHPILGLGDSPDQNWQEASWIQAFRAMRVEAIVLVAETAERLSPTSPASVPTVLVHCQPNDELQCDFIGLDRGEAARLGLAHICASGRKSVVVFGSTGSTFTESCRLWSQSPNGCKIQFYTTPVTTSTKMAQEYFSHYLRRRNDIDSALFQDSGVAASFLNLAVSSGVAIPDELSVVSYDYYPQADLLKVGLTTIEQPLTNLADRAIQMILNRVQRPSSPWAHEVLPHNIAPRDSG
jgi:DNA-binding LacI/PurR family transcriptional regulator